MSANAIAVPFTADAAIAGAGAAYCGFAVRETAGSTAEIRIYNSTSASGAYIGGATLAANAHAAIAVDRGIACANGIYVDVVSGAVSGTVWIA